MKLCAVYKSSRKADTYLYVPEKDDFSSVPEALLKAVGKAEFVMLVALDKREYVAQLPISDFISKLQSDGFYLQLPQKVDSLLKKHQKDVGHSPKL